MPPSRPAGPPGASRLRPFGLAAAILLTGSACGMGSHAPTVDRVTAREARDIDEVLAPWDNDGGPGAAVAVAHGGEVVYAEGYGSAHLEHPAPVTPATPFHVASVSKPFTAMAVGLLATEGKLSWDDELSDHLGWVPDLGAPVTLRQLASHTSGVRDQWQLLQLAGWRMDDVITRDQILRMMRRQRSLNFEPGTRHLYSNMGYSLLAEVVEEVSGEPFGAFLESHLFEPLGMDDTHVHDDHTHLVPGRAYSYVPGPSVLPGENAPSDRPLEWRRSVLSYANQGATSLFTTSRDLGTWLAALSDPDLLDPRIYEAMSRPTVLADGDTVSYGLGLSLEVHRGRTATGHGGADAGFRAYLLHLPEEELGVAVLANGPVAHTGVAARSVVDIVLGAREASRPGPAPELAGSGWKADATAPRGRDRSAEEAGAEPVPEAAEPKGARPHLREYEGAYYGPELDVIYRLGVMEDRLRLTRQRGPASTLMPTGPDTFRGPGPPPMSLTFIRDEEGEVTGFEVTTGRVEGLRFRRIDPLR